MMKILYRTHKLLGQRAQAIVEFALVLLILLMVLVGIMEVGRLMYIYAAVNNASREAVRYASAIGLDTDPDTGDTHNKYQFCKMIKDRAHRSAFFTTLTITISYDHGPGTSSFNTCDGDVDTGVQVNNISGMIDRVHVTVSATYNPWTNLIPIPSRTITSSSARTILGMVDVESGAVSVPTSGPSNTPIPGTATDTPIVIAPSDTPTATVDVQVGTFTPLATYTPSLVPTATTTPTVTNTPTDTPTPTLTFTPTVTSTPVPGCDSISTGSIVIVSNVMSLTITNPHEAITVSTVQVVWNAVNGGAGSKTLVLKSMSLGGVFWAGSDTSGNLTVTPSTTVTIPGNNQTSAIMFTFDRNYQNQNNSESIVITLSTPGCESYTIRKP
jgi:Flp pilus assembly protein TadG